jgi:hypothetical protein
MKNYDSRILNTTRLVSPEASRVEETGVRRLAEHVHSARRFLAVSEMSPPSNRYSTVAVF